MSRLRWSAVSFALGGGFASVGCAADEAANGVFIGTGSGGSETVAATSGGSVHAGTAGLAGAAPVLPVAGGAAGSGGAPGTVPVASSGGAGLNVSGMGGVAGVAGSGGSSVGGSLIPAGYTGLPWQGMPQKLPGKLEFELYDVGMEGVSFHDTTPINDGNGAFNLNIDREIAKFRRDEPVDISFTKTCCDRDNGVQSELDKSYVGWTAPGEWLAYTVDVAEAGTYVATGRFGVEEDMTLSFTVNGKKVGPFALEGTGSPHNWTLSEDLFEVELAAGKQLVRVAVETVGLVNMDWVEFEKKP